MELPMTIANKAHAAVNLFKRGGVSALLGEVAVRAAPSGLTRKLKWSTSIGEEITFWDEYIAQGGGSDEAQREALRERLVPDLPLQHRVAELLPASRTVHILDVGAGPLTYLGKKYPGKELKITAIDALAAEYDLILLKNNITPIIRTEKLEAEQIAQHFKANSFDLCFARNCLDHAYDPEDAINQMIAVVNPGCYVLLEHFCNEAEEAGHRGLHQWDFDLSSHDHHFLIKSRTTTVDMTERYENVCDISCEVTAAGDGRDWLITRIHKKG
jgi:SAM-dependent methyltransferase